MGFWRDFGRSLVSGSSDGDPPYLRRMTLAPDLTERVRRPRFQLMKWGGETPQYPPANHAGIQRNAYRNNAVFRRCVEYVSTNFASSPIRTVDADGAHLEDDPLARMLARGGRHAAIVPGLHGDTLVHRVYQDIATTGNSIWEKLRGSATGRVLEVRRIPVQHVAVALDRQTGDPAVYLVWAGGKWNPLPLRDVVHWMAPDTLQPYFGIPWIVSALRDLAVDVALTDHVKITLQNIAVPPIVIKVDANVDQEMADETRAVWQGKLGGLRKGEPAVVGGNTTIEALGFDMQALDLSNLLATSASRIAMVHGVPEILLGKGGAAGDPTRANYHEAKEHFWFDTVEPLQNSFEACVTLTLLPDFVERALEDGYRAAFDNSDSPVLQRAKLERSKTAAEIFERALVSRHRAQALAGIERHGPDVFYQPTTVQEVVAADAETEAGPNALIPGGEA